MLYSTMLYSTNILYYIYWSLPFYSIISTILLNLIHFHYVIVGNCIILVRVGTDCYAKISHQTMKCQTEMTHVRKSIKKWVSIACSDHMTAWVYMTPAAHSIYYYTLKNPPASNVPEGIPQLSLTWTTAGQLYILFNINEVNKSSI